MAFVGNSALATGTTSVQPTYAGATLGNTLIAFVTARAATGANTTLSGSTTGWTKRRGQASGVSVAEIWDKTAVGSDTMPTWNEASGLYLDCQILEWSGVTFDQSGTGTGTSATTITLTAGGTDASATDLLVANMSLRYASSTTDAAWTNNFNSHGVDTGVTYLTNNKATSAAQHTMSCYCSSATTGSSADKDVIAWTTGGSRFVANMASYKPTAVAPAPQNTVVNQVALQRASLW